VEISGDSATLYGESENCVISLWLNSGDKTVPNSIDDTFSIIQCIAFRGNCLRYNSLAFTDQTAVCGSHFPNACFIPPTYSSLLLPYIIALITPSEESYVLVMQSSPAFLRFILHGLHNYNNQQFVVKKSLLIWSMLFPQIEGPSFTLSKTTSKIIVCYVS
jgi:hypothetical protein